MITVEVSEYGIKATGHAGYAPNGEDIVCAAFTILIRVLAERIEENVDLLCEHIIDIGPGRAVISCTPTSENKHIIAEIFRTVTTGIDILNDEYPDYVKKIKKNI